MKRSHNQFLPIITVGFVTYFVFYFIFLFIHLDLIPLAWIDEIMGLDPALRYISGKGFTSQIWPQEGTRNHFMAYLPLQTWFHVIHLKMLPFSIYWVRFPWAFYLLLGTGFMFLGFKKNQLQTWIAVGLCILLINEKSLFETTRGVRVEPLIYLLFAIAFYAKAFSKLHLQSIAASLLILCHPDVWPLALVLFLNACTEKNSDSYILKPNVLWAYPILALLSFLWSIDFNLTHWLSQFVHQGSEHAASGGILDRLNNHFVLRFWPYYSTQPWVPITIYISLIGSLYQLATRRGTTVGSAVLLTHFVWFIALGPFHRYNSILFFIAIWWFIPYLIRSKSILKKQGIQVAITVFVILTSADVVARHYMAYAQHAIRNPYPVLSWLKEELPNEDYLLSGHSIGYYAMDHTLHNGFILANMPPYDYDFSNYKNYFILGERPIKGLETIGTYKATYANSSNYASKTYATLFLMYTPSKEEYIATLKAMDTASRDEVSAR